MAAATCDFSPTSHLIIYSTTDLTPRCSGCFLVGIDRAEQASPVPPVGPIPGTAPNWGHSSEREKLHAKGCRFGSVGQDGKASGDALPKTGDPAPILLLRNGRGPLAASTNRRRPLGVGDEDSDPSGGGVTRNEGRWVVGPRGSRLSDHEAPGWHLDRAYGRPGHPAEAERRNVPRPQTGAAAAVAVGTFFPVLRHRTARGVLY